MEKLFGLPDAKICALTELDCINNIANLVSGSSFPKVNQFLSQGFAGSEVNLNVMFRENSSKFH